MSYEPSGEGSNGVIIKKYGLLSPNVDVQEGRLSGYNIPYEKSGSISSPASIARRTHQKITSPSRGPARRDSVRRWLIRASEEASRMESLAQSGDLMELSNTGFRLQESLNELWKFRDEREEIWRDLLNILQGALAKEEFERFSVEQCQAISSVITDHLGAGAVDDDDVERSIRVLRKAGFDPWKGISGESIP